MKLEIKTRRGLIEAELFVGEAQATVDAVTELVESGFYDGTSIHRVVPGRLTQLGCPKGDGSGDSGSFRSFEESGHDVVTGTLAMASKGPGTESSQFFIAWEPAPELSGKHTVFGRIQSGIDVLYRLREGDAIERMTVVS